MDRFEDVYYSLSEHWSTNAQRYPDKEAIVCGNCRLTWREFDESLNRFANGLLDEGVKKGDRIAILMSNCIENLVAILGTTRAGACAVPLSPMLTSEQVATLMRDCTPVMAFFSEQTRMLAEPIRSAIPSCAAKKWVLAGAEAADWRGFDAFVATASAENPQIRLAAQDDFVIIYSSGTTGLPKGILHSHYSRDELAKTCALEMRFDHTARALTTTALYSAGTALMFLPALMLGGTMVILEQFTPAAFLDVVGRERITHTFLVPAQYLAILAHEDLPHADLSSLRGMLTGGSAMRDDTKREVEHRIKPCLYELYGTSEGIGTMMKPEQRNGRRPSGQPMTGHEMKVIDEDGNELPPGERGEVVGYASSLFKGYYNKPVESEAAIWRDRAGRAFFRTGDIAIMDAENFVTVVDRKKDMIISGGFNVYPIDIEAVIGQHDAVFDVTVIGIPHDKWGETPLALVIPRENCTATESDLAEWANQRLARHQRVVRVEFRRELPRNLLGKVLKRVLREQYCESPRS